MAIPRHKRLTHPGPDMPGCFGCRVASVQIAPSVLVSQRENDRDFAFQTKFDRENQEDREAYRRLRKEGLQPKSIAGSANAEKFAETKYEVESGYLFTDKHGQQLKEAVTALSDAGMDPMIPAAEPWQGD